LQNDKGGYTDRGHGTGAEIGIQNELDREVFPRVIDSGGDDGGVVLARRRTGSESGIERQTLVGDGDGVPLETVVASFLVCLLFGRTRRLRGRGVFCGGERGVFLLRRRFYRRVSGVDVHRRDCDAVCDRNLDLVFFRRAFYNLARRHCRDDDDVHTDLQDSPSFSLIHDSGHLDPCLVDHRYARGHDGVRAHAHHHGLSRDRLPLSSHPCPYPSYRLVDHPGIVPLSPVDSPEEVYRPFPAHPHADTLSSQILFSPLHIHLVRLPSCPFHAHVLFRGTPRQYPSS